MIQTFCSICKGKGKVVCPAIDIDERDNYSEKSTPHDLNCPICNGTNYVTCMGCMGGGIIDTNAYA